MVHHIGRVELIDICWQAGVVSTVSSSAFESPSPNEMTCVGGPVDLAAPRLIVHFHRCGELFTSAWACTDTARRPIPALRMMDVVIMDGLTGSWLHSWWVLQSVHSGGFMWGQKRSQIAEGTKASVRLQYSFLNRKGAKLRLNDWVRNVLCWNTQ